MRLKNIYQLIIEKKDPNLYTRDKILALLKTANNHPTYKSDIACLRLLLRIFYKQTTEERAAGYTKFYNDVGFSGADAELLTSFANQLIEKSSLTDNQMSIVRLKMQKYAKQMADLLNNKVIDKSINDYENAQINSVMKKWHYKNYSNYDFSNARNADGKTYDFSKAPIKNDKYLRRTMTLTDFDNLLIQKTTQPIETGKTYTIAGYNNKPIKVKVFKVNQKKNLIIFDVF